MSPAQPPPTRRNMAAFAAPIPLANTPAPSATICQTRRRARAAPRPSVRATATPNPPPPPSRLKERSVIALRFLSDLGGITILHELASRLSQHAQGGLIESELALGGLLGMWTAASFADRLRTTRNKLIAESRQLPDRWDRAVVYRPALDEDDVVSAVAWLFALDELEGIAAATLLRELADSESVPMRILLSEALAEFPIRSNVCLAILHDLSSDEEAVVRRAATDALAVYERSGIVVKAPSAVSVGAGVVAEDEQALKEVLNRLFKEPGLPLPPVDDLPIDQGNLAWMRDFVAERVDTMGSAALASPDLVRLKQQATGREEVVSSSKDDSKGLEVPFFEGLKWSEMHGLVALAMLPAGYELFSMIDGCDLPLRFIGLGWLLTVGGLVAYPQSAGLWRWMRKYLDTGVIST